MKNTRVPGHALWNEGAPFRWGGRIPVRVDRGWRMASSGEGFALCSCGATSDVLQTGAARKRWHAQHKIDVNRRDAT